MQEKYGFVYLWYDKKHKRFYIGCHWGTEDDGYVCSSTWMKNSHKRRPNDFKRRILSRIYTNKTDMFAKEMEWISLIKPEEIKNRYYNLNISNNTHWSIDEDASKRVANKVSLKNKNRTAWNKGHTKETHWTVRQYAKSLEGNKLSEETKEKLRQANLGKKHTEESKLKMGKSGEDNHFYGKMHSVETRQKIAEQQRGMMWVTDGVKAMRIDKEQEIPNGFRRGRK